MLCCTPSSQGSYDVCIHYHSYYICCVVLLPVRAVMMLAYTTTPIIYAVLYSFLSGQLWCLHTLPLLLCMLCCTSSCQGSYDACIHYHSYYVCCVVPLPVRAVMMLAYTTTPIMYAVLYSFLSGQLWCLHTLPLLLCMLCCTPSCHSYDARILHHSYYVCCVVVHPVRAVVMLAYSATVRAEVKLLYSLFVDCKHSSVRLVGPSPLEGRVEVCNHGVWGTICDRVLYSFLSFDVLDANVVCRQLAYSPLGN